MSLKPKFIGLCLLIRLFLSHDLRISYYYLTVRFQKLSAKGKSALDKQIVWARPPICPAFVTYKDFSCKQLCLCQLFTCTVETSKAVISQVGFAYTTNCYYCTRKSILPSFLVSFLSSSFSFSSSFFLFISCLLLIIYWIQ